MNGSAIGGVDFNYALRPNPGGTSTGLEAVDTESIFSVRLGPSWCSPHPTRAQFEAPDLANSSRTAVYLVQRAVRLQVADAF
jgi:hypothetical protein